MAVLILAAACGGNSTTNKEVEEQTPTRDERIDEITANAKEAFRSGSEVVSEFAVEAGEAFCKSLKKLW